MRASSFDRLRMRPELRTYFVSIASKARLRSSARSAPLKPPSPFTATTRWQGMNTGKGLLWQAWPMARGPDASARATAP